MITLPGQACKLAAMKMRIPRNEFTEQMVVLFAVTVPSLIGAGIGGGGGFFIGLVVAVPFAILVLRYMNAGVLSRRRGSSSRGR
jgi:hypothetical protein